MRSQMEVLSMRIFICNEIQVSFFVWNLLKISKSTKTYQSNYKVLTSTNNKKLQIGDLILDL